MRELRRLRLKRRPARREKAAAATIGGMNNRQSPLALIFAFLLLPLAAAADTIEIQAANGSYTQLGAQLQPIVQGPFTIHVASPRHEIKVHSNRLDLVKGPGLTVDARFEVELEGFGDLIADVVGPDGGSTHFEERVSARRQRIRVAATMRLQKVPQGYMWTLVAPLTPTIDFYVESGLSSKLVATCKVFAVLPILGAIDCGALENALTTLKVPMPKAGTQWLVAPERLTAGEKSFLDRFALGS